MGNEVRQIEIGKLRNHPKNPNRQDLGVFRKLKTNIERTGRYEPIVVRKVGIGDGFYEIINGHHRKRVLEELGFEYADCVVWDVDDEETDILLLTLNRLGGREVFERKRELLRRLGEKMKSSELCRILPDSEGAIEKLRNFSLPSKAVSVKQDFMQAEVFFLKNEDKEILDRAIAVAEVEGKSRNERRSKALVKMSLMFLGERESN